MSKPRGIREALVVAVSTGLALVALAAGSGAATATVPAAPEDVLSHFLCYDGTFAKHDPVKGVGLEDQFGLWNATVGAPTLLCNPVRKTRGDVVTKIVDPNQHLRAYKVRVALPVSGTRQVSDSNQFATDQVVTLSNTPTRILVPTRKFPHDRPQGLDHFLCYPVTEGKSIDRRVRLRDEFASIVTQVLEPRLHCNPVLKNHPGHPIVPIAHQDAHLLCYQIGRKPLDPPQVRKTANQFERVRVQAETAVLLCVPSTKQEIHT